MAGRSPVLGILGGGQLGRMTAMAAIRMGVEARFLVPRAAPPVAHLGEVTLGDWTDPELLREFAAGCDAITVESEWAPAELLEPVLPTGTTLVPTAATVLAIRNKIHQKERLAAAGLPVPAFRVCRSPDDIAAAARELGLPLMLKRPLGSYDGYGNFAARSASDLEEGWNRLGGSDGVLAEQWIEFSRELAVIVARARSGEHVIYPVACTEQRDHRCHAVVVPSGASKAVEQRAREVALDAVEAVGGHGVTAVEMFETVEGEILVNELAPRPHNTGHYTIDACHTSQFENHVRAVLGLPLGDPSMRVPAACMVNIIGHRSGASAPEGLREALAISGASIHLYGKPETRPGRKMGHATVTADEPATARRIAEEAAALLRF